MAGFKKIMLTEKEGLNNVSQSVDEQVVESSSLANQVDKFDNSYTADKLTELYNEFDSITLDGSTTLVQRDIQETTAAVSVRTKIYLTAGIVIALLLMFLAIYNIFVINSLNDSIHVLQDEVAYQEYQVIQKADSLDGLMDENVIKVELGDEWTSSSMENATVLNNVARVSSKAIEGETNWFDKFCDFISSIFRG